MNETTIEQVENEIKFNESLYEDERKTLVRYETRLKALRFLLADLENKKKELIVNEEF